MIDALKCSKHAITALTILLNTTALTVFQFLLQYFHIERFTDILSLSCAVNYFSSSRPNKVRDIRHVRGNEIS